MNWLKRQRSTPTPEALVDAILDSIMTGPDAEIEEAFTWPLTAWTPLT